MNKTIAFSLICSLLFSGVSPEAWAAVGRAAAPVPGKTAGFVPAGAGAASGGVRLSVPFARNPAAGVLGPGLPSVEILAPHAGALNPVAAALVLPAPLAAGRALSAPAAGKSAAAVLPAESRPEGAAGRSVAGARRAISVERARLPEALGAFFDAAEGKPETPAVATGARAPLRAAAGLEVSYGRSGEREVVMVMIAAKDAEEIKAKAAEWKARHGFQFDFSFKPHRAPIKVPLWTIRGSIPKSGRAGLRAEAGVVSVSNGIGSVDSVVPVEYVRPASENLLRRALRAAYEKAPLLSMLAAAPAAFAILAAIAGPGILASGMVPLGALGWVMMAGTATALVAMTPAKILLSWMPVPLQMGVLHAPLAIGGLLMLPSAPFAGALALFNAFAAYLAAMRFFAADPPNAHPADKFVNGLQLNLLFNALGFSLMGLGWLATQPLWSWWALGAGAVILALMAVERKNIDLIGAFFTSAIVALLTSGIGAVLGVFLGMLKRGEDGLWSKTPEHAAAMRDAFSAWAAGILIGGSLQFALAPAMPGWLLLLSLLAAVFPALFAIGYEVSRLGWEETRRSAGGEDR